MRHSGQQYHLFVVLAQIILTLIVIISQRPLTAAEQFRRGADRFQHRRTDELRDALGRGDGR